MLKKWMWTLLLVWTLFLATAAFAVPPSPPVTLTQISGGAELLYRPSGGDDVAGLQALANKLKTAGGGTIRLALGRYKISGTSSLTLDNVRLYYPGALTTYDKVIANGADTFPPVSVIGLVGGPLVSGAACIFDITGNEGNPSAESPFILLNGAACEGFTVNQPHNLYSLSTPYHYPYVFHILHEATVQDIGFINIDQGIKCEGRRPMVRYAYGFVLTNGLLLDHCPDVSRIENVHWFQPGDLTSASGLFVYAGTHLTAFDVRRCDAAIFNACTVYHCNIGFRLAASDASSGPNAPWAVFANCLADEAYVCIKAEAVQQQGVDFSNFHGTCHTYGVEVTATLGAGGSGPISPVRLHGGVIYCQSDATTALKNEGGNCLFLDGVNLQSLVASQPLFVLDAGNTILSGCLLEGATGSTSLLGTINTAARASIVSPFIWGSPLIKTQSGTVISASGGMVTFASFVYNAF